MPTVLEKLLTADEFARIPDDGVPAELVRGRIVRMPMPRPRHGQVCNNISYHLTHFVKPHDMGHVLCNDSGVITERDPDTVRGADVAYYSYSRVPKGPLPEHHYLTVAPEVVFEVRSPDDKWSKLQAKVAEYLEAGVLIVCVVEPVRGTVTVYTADEAPEKLTGEAVLTLADVLPGFSVPISAFFE
jgi:Uma2 family endonuclease